MLLGHLLDAPGHDAVVRHFLIRAGEGGELDAADAIILGLGMQCHSTTLAREVFVEIAAADPAVVDLSGPEDDVAVLGEMAVQQFIFTNAGPPVLIVLIATGAART